MKKKLHLMMMGVLLSVTALQAQTPQLNLPTRHNEKAQAVEWLMHTPAGKGLDREQVAKAMARPNILKAEAAKSHLLLTENFNTLTAGTENEPDTAEMNDSVAAKLLPNWTAWHVHQAGGKAYLSYVDTNEGDPGYLMTPNLNLTKYQGVFRVTFRCKNVNPNANDQLLQYFVLNNDDAHKSMISASALPMTTDWTTCSFTTSGGVENTAIMFFGWQGKVLIDSVAVEQLEYPLGTPQNIKVSAKNGSTLLVKWDGVENATKYRVETYNYGDISDNTSGGRLDSTVVEGTQTEVSGDFNATNGVTVCVTALNDEGESYPGWGYNQELSVPDVAAPVALAATNISAEGFTANWQASENAHTYKLNLIRNHEAVAGDEPFTYFADGFSEITTSKNDPKSTLLTPDGMPVSLDDAIKYAGWSSYLCTAFTGYLGITNRFAGYGYPGAMYSPAGNYSINGGKAHVSGTAATMQDDAVVKIGFGSLNTQTRQITYIGTPKEVTITKSGTNFDADIEGGTDNCQIIFEITDAAEGGDIVLFDTLAINSTLKKGERITAPYASVTQPYNATSFQVNVPFTGNDIFYYYVTGEFGSQKSGKSDTITVYAPTFNAIQSAHIDTQKAMEVYTISGIRLNISTSEGLHALRPGVYVIRQGDKVCKIRK